MCDTVSVAIIQDDDGISVQVTSGTDTGLRLEHAAQVAMGTFQQALQVASVNHLALQAASSE